MIHHMHAGSRPGTVLAPDGMLKAPDPELRQVRQSDLSQITGIPK